MFSTILTLIRSNFSLNSSFTQLEYNTSTNKVSWQDEEGGHSTDAMTFYCKVVVDKVSDLLMAACVSISELPTFSQLFQMVVTDRRQYIEQMRGIISCV